MHEAIADLASARILVSNDDGIHAPGLKVLERVARSLSKDVWVVAPEDEQSCAAHSLTLRRPLRLRQVARRRFAVDGTPTDAVLLGVRHLLHGKRPDLVLSGINRGANLGDDVTYSGTVSAALEATLLGLPAIALSLEAPAGEPPKWATAEHFAADVIRRVAAVGWSRNVCINVNFPDRSHNEVAGVEVTRLGRRKLGEALTERLDPRGEPYVWIGSQRAEDRGQKGTDLEAVARGAVTVTPLTLEITHAETMRHLRTVFP